MGRHMQCSNAGVDSAAFVPGEPVTQQTRFSGRSGAGTPASFQLPSHVQQEAQKATAASLGVIKSLTGVPAVENSLAPPRIGSKDSYPEDEVVRKPAEEPDITGVRPIYSRAVDRPHLVPRRAGSQKGFASNLRLSFRRERPPEPDNLQRQPDTKPGTSWFRNIGARQAPAIRTPTRKAFVVRSCFPEWIDKHLLSHRSEKVTADSSPTIHGNYNLDPLDHTARDSDRFQKCLVDRLEVKPKDIRVLKAVGNDFITEVEFMSGLDDLLASAGAGDLLILYVSMHATLFNSESVYLTFFKGDGQPAALIGTQELVNAINKKLGQVCCTVEVILDVCYAAGLIKYQHIIRQMKFGAPQVVVSTTTESFSVADSPLLFKGQYVHDTAGLPTPRFSPSSTYPLPSSTYPLPSVPKHITRTIATGAPLAMPSFTGTVVASSFARNRGFFLAQAPVYVAELQTPSVIIVWAAAKQHQQAWEYGQNGALTDAICDAVEFPFQVANSIFAQPRRIIDHGNLQWYQSPENVTLEEQDKLSSPCIQHAQLGSNFNDAERILQGHVFYPVSRETS
ncbi:ICE-like protease (caspase) p20 domain protein [Ceratobasidium sp. AG-Ba]|nr:ICE-like protease (caspase) p20 domain protein [Ceratobasidium sp. AG-Ba]QRW12587.1 ICE-like protease (caspase) p20 domain protein [Ceratobasidium sp. AG-Ba]